MRLLAVVLGLLLASAAWGQSPPERFADYCDDGKWLKQFLPDDDKKSNTQLAAEREFAKNACADFFLGLDPNPALRETVLNLVINGSPDDPERTAKLAAMGAACRGVVSSTGIRGLKRQIHKTYVPIWKSPFPDSASIENNRDSKSEAATNSAFTPYVIKAGNAIQGVPNQIFSKLCISVHLDEQKLLRPEDGDAETDPNPVDIDLIRGVWRSSEAGYNYGVENVIGAIFNVDAWEADGLFNLIKDASQGFVVTMTANIAGFARTIFIIIATFALIFLGWQVIMQNAELSGFVKSLLTLAVMSAVFLYLMGTYPLEEHTELEKDAEGELQVLLDFKQGSAKEDVEVVRFIGLVVGFGDFVSSGFREATCKTIKDASTPLGGSGLGGAETQTGSRSGLMQVTYSTMCSAGQPITPGTIFEVGLKKAISIMLIPMQMQNRGNFIERSDQPWSMLKLDQIEKWFTQTIQTVIGTFLGILGMLVVGIVWALVALVFVLMWVEGFFVMCYGVFLLGFAVWDQTKDKAISYMWYCVGWVVRIGMAMILFIVIYLALEMAVSQIPFVGRYESFDALTFNIITFTIYVLLQILLIAIVYMVLNSVLNTLGQMLGSTSRIGDSMEKMVKQTAQTGLAMGVGAAGVGAGAIAAAPAAATNLASRAVEMKHGIVGRMAGTQDARDEANIKQMMSIQRRHNNPSEAGEIANKFGGRAGVEMLGKTMQKIKKGALGAAFGKDK